ncbi:hypothetical protein DIPPA_27854 [Diplonema papillatum]|nr:hypothetical protein DIPPA_33766 [Diplonema papillatum]KAJ9446118.1 hypothetical protein DIPPA_27854 [Diplonema papillatum]
MSVVRTQVTQDEMLIAWRALIDELSDLRDTYEIGVNPEWLGTAIRQGTAKDLDPPTRPIGLSISAATPLHRVKLVKESRGVFKNARLECELLYHIPPGYPVVPPVEQGAGDIVVNMPGHLAKSSMQALGRDLHMRMIELYETQAACGALPRYIEESLRWMEEREVCEAVAAHCVADPGKVGKSKSRAWVRFHHVESELKTAYGLMWAADHRLGGFLGKGQPGFAVVEGDTEHVRVWLEKFTSVVHWGPVPARVVQNAVISPASGEQPLPPLKELSLSVPSCVTVGGAFNGRNSIHFDKLLSHLQKKEHLGAADDLQRLLDVFRHDDGHVDADKTELAIRESEKESACVAAKKKTDDKKKTKAKKRLQ